MRENFDLCYELVRKYEGGNDDDKRDPGGRTSRGILQREYDAWRKKRGYARKDVWKASEDEILQIYRENYWNRIGADGLPSGIDLAYWDGAVNSGVRQATRWAQRSANSQGSTLEEDGILGPRTRSAIASVPDVARFVNEFCDRRLSMLRQLSTWPYYGRGWTARVEDVRKHSSALAE